MLRERDLSSWGIAFTMANATCGVRAWPNTKRRFGQRLVAVTARALITSSEALMAHRWDGSTTLNTPIAIRSRHWTAGSVCACAAFYVSVTVAGDADGVPIISAGPMLSLPNMGCSPWQQPMRRPVNPFVSGEPPTGEPYAGDPHVRFGGRGRRTQSSLPTPIDYDFRRAQPGLRLITVPQCNIFMTPLCASLPARIEDL